MEHIREEYRGHRPELRPPKEGPEAGPEREPELLIDGEPVRYGQLPDGRYALEDYAYDWHDNLMDLARRYIDYQNEADEARRQGEQGVGGVTWASGRTIAISPMPNANASSRRSTM